MTRLWRTMFIALLGLFLLAAALGFFAWRHRGDLAYLYVPSPAEPPRAARQAAALPAPKTEIGAPEKTAVSPPVQRPMSWAGLRLEPYSGRFAGDGDAITSLGDLDQALAGAMKDLKDSSDLYPSAQNHALFKPLDYQSCAFKQPFEVVDKGGGECSVEFAVEPLMLKWWAARDMLAAALCRVLLTEDCPGYADSPEWFRAGLSLKLSGLGPVYETRSLLELNIPPMQAISGLGESGERQWLNGYWAFRSIEARHGGEGIRALIGSLKRGESWQAALKASGEDPDAFDSRYREWSKAYLKDRAANRESFLSMISLLREQREEDAAPLLEAFVKEQPLDLYTGDARYWLGNCNYRLGRYDEASRGLADLLTNSPYTTSLQGKGLYFLGRCYQMMGYAPMALPEYAAAAREPDNPLLVRLATARLEAAQ